MLKDKKQRLYIILKTALSVGAWIVALISSFHSNSFDALKYILPALMLCTLGDILLAFSDEIKIRLLEPYFTLGVASFGAAHIIFGLYFLSICEFNISWTLLLSPLTALLLWYFKKNGILKCGKYNISIMLYALLVGAFLGLGLNLYMICAFSKKIILLCVASVLFWISDLTLSFRYFSRKSPFILGVIVLTIYFTSIYMLAFSLLI